MLKRGDKVDRRLVKIFKVSLGSKKHKESLVRELKRALRRQELANAAEAVQAYVAESPLA